MPNAYAKKCICTFSEITPSANNEGGSAVVEDVAFSHQTLVSSARTVCLEFTRQQEWAVDT